MQSGWNVLFSSLQQLLHLHDFPKSCSHVSTYAGRLTEQCLCALQLRMLFKTVPDTLHAYIYLMSTILGGIVLGVAIYGWADWQS